MQPLPLPWNPTYLNLWFDFVEALAKEFGNEPALSLVAVSGPSGHNTEVNLPRDPLEDGDPLKQLYPKYDALRKWRKLVGDGPNADEEISKRILEAYRQTIDCFHRAFAEKYDKYINLQIFEKSLPVESDDVQWNFQTALIKYAMERKNPDKHFVLMNASLDGWPFDGPRISKRYQYPERPPQWVRIGDLSRQGFVTGFEARHPYEKKKSGEVGTPQSRFRFLQMMKNGIGFGASFIEIYERDLVEDVQDMVAATRIILRNSGVGVQESATFKIQ